MSSRVGIFAPPGPFAGDALERVRSPAGLARDETIPDGIRRVARGQLDQAHTELGQSPKRKLAAAVHDTRKSLKRLRTTVRLARGGIGEEIYRRENAAFRDTGRRLSGVRDASVMVETLHELEKFYGDELPRGAPDELHERFEEERKQALESLSADDGVLARVLASRRVRRTLVSPAASGRTPAWRRRQA